MSVYTPAVVREGFDVLDLYFDMLEDVHGRCPAAAKTMGMAFRDWLEGECDTGSGVPMSDLETRLCRVVGALS